MPAVGTSKPPQQGHTLPRTPVIVGVVVGAIVVVVLVALAISKTGHTSNYLSIEKDVSGVVTKVSSDGQSVALRTRDGSISTRVLNAGEFPLQPGDRVRATLVLIPLQGGSGQQDALVVYSAARAMNTTAG